MDSKTFETSELKLAALVLAEIPDTRFEVTSKQIQTFFFFKIYYPSSSQSSLDKLIQEFENKTARVDVFLFNQKLRYLRGAIADKKGIPQGGERRSSTF